MQGLSTIITFYNGLSSLKMCINLLQDALKAEDIYEIIVVNDNPTMKALFETETKRICRKLRKMKCVGFLRLCRGI